jgi:hypothetical protein
MVSERFEAKHRPDQTEEEEDRKQQILGKESLLNNLFVISEASGRAFSDGVEAFRKTLLLG